MVNINPTFDRARRIAVIKAVLAGVTLLIMLITFPYPIPLAVAAIDLLLIPVFLILVRINPTLATYLLVIQTTLAFTPRQFTQGYVNGINWVFYLPIPSAAAYILSSRAALWRATIIVTAIALPIMLTAALTLPPMVTRAEILTFIAYLVVVLWGFAWINSADKGERSSSHGSRRDGL